MTLSETLADRVHELKRERNALREQVKSLRASRDLWKHRALRKAGLSPVMTTARPGDQLDAANPAGQKETIVTQNPVVVPPGIDGLDPEAQLAVVAFDALSRALGEPVIPVSNGRCPHGHVEGSCPYGRLCRGYTSNVVALDSHSKKVTA